MKLFKKKAGGTAVGNILRVAANKATGGILGTGANRLPAASTPSASADLQTAATTFPSVVAAPKAGDEPKKPLLTPEQKKKAGWGALLFGLIALGYYLTRKPSRKGGTRKGW